MVSTIAEKKKVINWMISNEGPNVAARAVDKFPDIFIQRDRALNRKKAGDWWRKRLLFMATSRNIIQKQFPVKENHGRRRKRKEWVMILHDALLNEFQRVRKLGVKVNDSLLKEIAVSLLNDPNVPVSVQQNEELEGRLIGKIMTNSWMQNFKNRFDLVGRVRTANKTLSHEKVVYYKNKNAYFLGELNEDTMLAL